MDVNTKARHVLNRFAFGPSFGQIEKLAASGEKGLQQWFDGQLSRSTQFESNIQNQLKSLSSLKMTNAQLMQKFPKRINEMDTNGMPATRGSPQEIIRELSMHKLLRACESESQLEEVLVDFWFNHFNVYFDKGQVRYLVTSHERDVIRPHVFGRFQDMLLATAQSPAMLMYLDNASSRKGNINENYARELFELHTLGVDNGYTQKDIQESARVLTGWGVDQPKEIGEYKYFPKRHDRGSKQVMELSFSGQQGEEEGKRLIEYLAHHKNTAAFIARKLAIKFISDTPSEKTVASLAKAFTDSKGNLKTVYKALFQSEELWSDKNVSVKIKTPFEYVVSAVRATASDFIPDEERINKLKGFFAQSGQELYRCQPPTGYKATADYWVNPGAMINRINFAMSMVKDQLPQINFEASVLTKPIADQKYQRQIDVLIYLNKEVFGSIIKKANLEKIDTLLNDSQNYREVDGIPLPLPYYPIPKMVALMLSTPEFQRR